MKNGGDPDPGADVVCRRELTRVVEGNERPVSLTVLRPVPEGNHFACEIRVAGLGTRPGSADTDPVVLRVLGIDAMQALLIAFQGLRLVLRPHERELAWFGERGETGIPLIVNSAYGDSTEFFTKIEAVVERENERSLKKVLRLRRARRAT